VFDALSIVVDKVSWANAIFENGFLKMSALL
jgi:hypothetical protein